MKVTRRMLESMISNLNRNLNRPSEAYSTINGKLVAQVGHFHLGVMSPGDGWTRYSVLEMRNEGGGVNQRFSGNNQDVYAYLCGVDDATRLQSFPKHV